LLLMGANPIYDAPADFDFLSAMNKVPLRVHHGLYRDETAEHAHWHINGTHYLEEWGDGRAFDGTYSIVQPLIAPLYNGKSEYEFIFALVGSSETAGYDIVRKCWQDKLQGGDFDAQWRKALNEEYFSQEWKCPGDQ
jgi:anaerobic selenocysteine-containing dehydrogenase